MPNQNQSLNVERRLDPAKINEQRERVKVRCANDLRALDALEWFEDALSEDMVFLDCTGVRDEEAHPFTVSFVWDEKYFGELLRYNLMEDMLERFRDAPEYYRAKILAAREAVRAFDAELETLLAQSQA